MFYYLILHYITLHYITLYYIILYYIILYYVISFHIVSSFILFSRVAGLFIIRIQWHTPLSTAKVAQFETLGLQCSRLQCSRGCLCFCHGSELLGQFHVFLRQLGCNAKAMAGHLVPREATCQFAVEVGMHLSATK